VLALSGPLVVPAFGMAAGIGWGLADFFGARAARRLPPALTALAVQAIGAVVFAAMILPAHHRAALTLPADAIGYAAAGGVVMTVGQVLFYFALRAGPVSIVSPISSGYPLVTTVVALLLGARLQLREAAGIIAVVIGVALASGLPSSRISAQGRAAGARLAVGAAAAWGLAFPLVGEAVHRSNWQAATLVELVAGTLAFAAVVPFVRPASAAPVRALLTCRWVWLAAVTQQAAEAAFNIGLGHASSPAVVTAVSACYPALTVFLALRTLGEEVDVGALSGAALTMGGIAVLSL
jgi:drug/metabolite transporter (DMT)-like permease